MLSIIDEVLVVGHHDPDTDAVCSALGYAAFYAWQTGEKAIACHVTKMATAGMKHNCTDQILFLKGRRI